MRYFTLTILTLFTYGFMFTELSAQTETSTASVERLSLKIGTPTDVIHVELHAAKKALTQGNHKGALSHAYNLRSIAKQMNLVPPKELQIVELIAHHLQIATMITEADDAYRKGSYDRAVFEYGQILFVMKEFGIKPPHEVFLLAQKINSRLLQAVYITERCPPPESRRI